MERLELQDLVVEEVEAAAAHHATGSAAPAPEEDGDASIRGHPGSNRPSHKCEVEDEHLKMIVQKHVQEVVQRMVSEETAKLAHEKLAMVRQVEELRAKHQRAMVEFLSDFTRKMAEKDCHVKSCELECERRIEEERQRSLGLRAELDRLGAQTAAMAEQMDGLLLERAQLVGQLERLRAECERLSLGRLAAQASDLSSEAERLVKEVSQRLDELPALIQAFLAPQKARVGSLLAELRARGAPTERPARRSGGTSAPSSTGGERREGVVGDAEAEPAGAPPAAAKEGASVQRVFVAERQARPEGLGPAEGSALPMSARTTRADGAQLL